MRMLVIYLIYSTANSAAHLSTAMYSQCPQCAINSLGPLLLATSTYKGHLGSGSFNYSSSSSFGSSSNPTPARRFTSHTSKTPPIASVRRAISTGLLPNIGSPFAPRAAFSMFLFIVVCIEIQIRITKLTPKKNGNNRRYLSLRYSSLCSSKHPIALYSCLRTANRQWISLLDYNLNLTFSFLTIPWSIFSCSPADRTPSSQGHSINFPMATTNDWSGQPSSVGMNWSTTSSSTTHYSDAGETTDQCSFRHLKRMPDFSHCQAY